MHSCHILCCAGLLSIAGCQGVQFVGRFVGKRLVGLCLVALQLRCNFHPSVEMISSIEYQSFASSTALRVIQTNTNKPRPDTHTNNHYKVSIKVTTNQQPTKYTHAKYTYPKHLSNVFYTHDVCGGSSPAATGNDPHRLRARPPLSHPRLSLRPG